jgi:hypothetical protein
MANLPVGLVDKMAQARAEVARLASIIDAPARRLPAFSSTGSPETWLEIDDHGFHVLFDDSGRELVRTTYGTMDEMLYHVFQSVTFSMASDVELKLRLRGVDSRRQLFQVQEQLMDRLSPAWGARKRAEHAQILSKHPFDDALAKRADRWGDLMRQGLPRAEAVAQAEREIPSASSKPYLTCTCNSQAEYWDTAAVARQHQLEEVKTTDDGWTTLFRCPECGSYWLRERPQGHLHGGGPLLLRRMPECRCAVGVPDAESETYTKSHLVREEAPSEQGEGLARCIITGIRWRKTRTGLSRCPVVQCACTKVRQLEGKEAAEYLDGHLHLYSYTGLASERKYTCPETRAIWTLDYEPFKPWKDARKRLERLH